LVRRSTGIVVALVIVMLVGAAAAQADFNATAGQQFSGVVDSTPSGCPNPSSVMIDWGDSTPQSAGTFSATSGVSGTHTYAAKGT
jgi:hypothetical protein